MKVCLLTTGQPSTNPRLVKEADALAAAFGFTTYAMIFPLVTEFDVALGRTTAPMDE